MAEATQQRSVEQLQREATEAMSKAQRLAERLGTIDREIEEEKERLHNQRVAAAKRGESVSSAADPVDLQRLEREREELPFDHFAARLEAVGLQIAEHQARVDEITPQLREAREELAPLQQEAQEATRRAAEQEYKVSQLEGAKSATIARSRELQAAMGQIEQQGVQPLS